MVLTNDGTGTAIIGNVVVNGVSMDGFPGVAIYDCVCSFTVGSSFTWIPAAGFNGYTIQGHMFSKVDECTIPAGQTAIIYLAPEYSLGEPGNSSLVGQTITVNIPIQGSATLSEQVTVVN